MVPIQKEKFYSRAEVSAILGITYGAVKRIAEKGKLKERRFDRYYKIKGSDLQTYIENAVVPERLKKLSLFSGLPSSNGQHSRLNGHSVLLS